MAKILSNSLEVGGPPGAALCMLGGTEGRVWYTYNVINEYIYNDCILMLHFIHYIHVNLQTFYNIY